MDELTLNFTEGDPMIVDVEGSIDTVTAPDFQKAIEEKIDEGVKNFIIDMTACRYVSSAGLRAIVSLQKRLLDSGSIVYRGVAPEVMEVFEITGFNHILTFA